MIAQNVLQFGHIWLCSLSPVTGVCDWHFRDYIPSLNAVMLCLQYEDLSITFI